MEVFKKDEIVEGYRIMSELGRGAASIIYLVLDEKTKHVWALKDVQRIDDKSERFMAQAEAEYKIAQKLDHETIRKIPRMIKKKKGLLQLNRLFLVMELVDGKSMDIFMPKTFEQACLVFRQAGQAMQHMHEKGFVHADFKPNNLIVDSDNVAKIIDLGQSCPIGTIKKRIQGTPDYIAPEQVHRREITPKTDVYNLGASMYWVLTRKKVPTALGKEGSLMGRVDDSLLEKPKPAIEINERIPPKLSELIMQCLEVDPDTRPDMNQVIDRLDLIHAMLKAGVKNKTAQMKALDD
ncbi:MAG: serine/threonine protein kinase [Phycisphaera sp.]|nr:MAG: serine/threonine protein kinase [Phycisphaera sp.]